MAWPWPHLLFLFAFFTLVLAQQSRFSGKTCRIMPLGASITFGVGSTDGNGYRAKLFDLLTADGNNITMVGSQKGGTSPNPDNEGYPGFVIAEVDDKAKTAMDVQLPSIVTLLVGTNDMLQDIDVGDAPARLTKLIQDVLDAPPLTLVVVSTLPPNANAAANARINTYNTALPDVVQGFVSRGRSVVLVDSHVEVAVDDLVDGTHPNDAAYARMALVFYNGIQQAFSNNWIFDVEPLPGSSPSSSVTVERPTSTPSPSSPSPSFPLTGSRGLSTSLPSPVASAFSPSEPTPNSSQVLLGDHRMLFSLVNLWLGFKLGLLL